MTWKISGSTELPLGDREREWDQEAARKRIFNWAGWEDDPKPSQAQRAFFAYNDETPTNLTSYKLPFADVVDGKLQAMPRGLFAVAQLLRGARDGIDLPEDLLKYIRSRVTVYYDKMHETAPWKEPNGETQKSMPGKMGPVKREMRIKAARRAAHTRARRGTQKHGSRRVGVVEKKKRIRAAHNSGMTRERHTA